MARKELMLMVDTKRDALHFCATKLQGDNIWFPLHGNPFSMRGVENILVLNGIVCTVVGMEKIRTCGVCEDWKVTIIIAD